MNPLSKRESGQAFILVLILLLIGGLMLPPLLSLVSTGLKASQVYQQKTDELYAADAGVEYALWKIRNGTPPFSSYHITGINGLSVDIDIDEADTIAGQPVGTGKHEWLIATVNVTYDAGDYTYTISVLNITNETDVHIAKILIALPPGVDYVPDSTSSNLTQPLNDEPSVNGSPMIGITPVWENETPQPIIPAGEIKHHCFKLSGPPGIEGIEGHGFVDTQPTAAGTVWIMDVVLYCIRSQAKDASGAVLAEIGARVWGSSQLLDISSWQIIP